MRLNQHGPCKEIFCLGNAPGIISCNRKGDEKETVWWQMKCFGPSCACGNGLKVELLDVVCSNQAVCFKPILLLQRRAAIDEAVVDYLKTRRENCFWTEQLKSP